MAIVELHFAWNSKLVSDQQKRMKNQHLENKRTWLTMSVPVCRPIELQIQNIHIYIAYLCVSVYMID